MFGYGNFLEEKSLVENSDLAQKIFFKILNHLHKFSTNTSYREENEEDRPHSHCDFLQPFVELL